MTAVGIYQQHEMVERVGDIDEGNGPPGKNIGMHDTGPDHQARFIPSIRPCGFTRMAALRYWHQYLFRLLGEGQLPDRIFPERTC